MKEATNNEKVSNSPLGAGGFSGSLNMHFGAHPLIFKKAEELRNKMPLSEELLWNDLRSNKWGFKWRRQHPLFMYVADFYCHYLKLIIEIDGSIHELEEVKRNDEVRQKHLENLGIKVIRFSNNDVLYNIESVLSHIRKILQHGSTSK